MHEKTWSCHCFNGAEKNSREKCQQPIAAGFCCRRRHGLWFPHVSFLSHYASSSHPIKHKYRLQLREHLGTAPPGRNRQRREQRGKKGWFKTKQWADVIVCVCVCATWLHFKDGPLGRPSLRTCQFVSSLISPFCVSLWRVAFSLFVLFWFSDMSRLPGSLSKWWLMMFAELWRGADMKHGRASTQEPQLNPSLSLPRLPWLHAGSKVQQPKRGCEKPCLIPSSGI